MAEENDDSERKPVEKTCKICGYEDIIENMINCPKYADDLDKKGIVPGWIHEHCCEQSFLEDSEECIESCDDEKLLQNIEEYFEQCVDVEGLTKTETRRIDES